MINRFQFKISREKATSLMIKDLYLEIPELRNKFEEFVLAWNSLKLKEIAVGCQNRKFTEIDDSKSLSFFLPNQEKDESGFVILGALISLRSLHLQCKNVSQSG